MRLVKNNFYILLTSLIIFSMGITVSKADLPSNQTEFLSPDEAFVMTYDFVEENTIKIKWDIHPGYYLYMGMFEFESMNEGNKIRTVKMPEGKKKKDEFFGEVDVYYYIAEADIILEKNITRSVELKVKYQGCADAGLCYPPISKKLILKKKESLDSLKKTSMFESQNAMSDSLRMNSLLYNTIIFYLAGLLLAFTPCVLPMVPILTGIIAGQGNVTQKRSLGLSGIYVLSMSFTYSLAGVIVALSGTNIQANLQNPYVISVISFLFFIFALSMFRFFELQMPKSIQTLMSNLSNKQKSGSYKDVAIMGFLSALIVGPCVTAPLIGALIYIASTGDILVGGLALFALGIGMGTPLIVLGSTTTKIVSKIGPYLELVNYFFGVLFIVVSIWLLERIISIHVAAYLWSIASVILIFVLIKASNKISHPVFKIMTYFSSFFLVLYFGLQINGIQKNVYFDPLTSFIEKKQVVKFITVRTTQGLFDEIENADKPVMVDLYADWCVACKEFEKYTFADARVSKILNQMKLIKFDITKNTEDHSEYLQRMRIFGPPVLFFYDSNGLEIKKARVVGFMESDNFLKVLNLVKY